MTEKTDNRAVSIRAITFDLDDTLWAIGPTMLRAEQRLHDWLGLNYPRIVERYSATELRELRHEAVSLNPAIAHDFTVLRQHGLKLAAERTGYTSFDPVAAYSVFFAARNEVMFYDDVLPVLEKLARRYPLVALSNGNADIEQVGLGHLFSFALSAEAVGKPKPDPAMFMLASERLGIATTEIVHVGDDPVSDVFGGRQAGLRTVWLNRTADLAWQHDYRADVEIQSLLELESVLSKLLC